MHNDITLRQHTCIAPVNGTKQDDLSSATLKLTSSQSASSRQNAAMLPQHSPEIMKHDAQITKHNTQIGET